MKLYHIDRKRSLREGMVLELYEFKGFDRFSINDVDMSQNFNSIVKNLFDNELSSHGYTYINNLDPCSNLPRLELVYELIRKIQYSNCPSRYKSFFAVEKKDIRKLLNVLKIDFNNCYIYEVESDKYFKADMNLLKGDGRIIDLIFAQKYWGQEESDDPLFEYLLEYPVKVGKRIYSLDEI